MTQQSFLPTCKKAWNEPGCSINRGRNETPGDAVVVPEIDVELLQKLPPVARDRHQETLHRRMNEMRIERVGDKQRRQREQWEIHEPAAPHRIPDHFHHVVIRPRKLVDHALQFSALLSEYIRGLYLRWRSGGEAFAGIELQHFLFPLSGLQRSV